MPTMKQKRFRNPIDIIGIFLIAFLIDALIFKHIPFQYQNAIALSDILSFLVTIILALYLAHVVEKSREQKNAIGNVLANMIQSLISECDDIQKALYANNLNYLQAVAFTKKLHQACSKICDIMGQAEFDCDSANATIKKLKNKKALRDNLTTITPQKPDDLDFLEVQNNICSIGPSRIGKIQKNITDLRHDLYYLWATINM